MPEEGLKELYVDELKDLYNAEPPVKALPKMAKAATSPDLRAGFGAPGADEGPCLASGNNFRKVGRVPKGKKWRNGRLDRRCGSEAIEEHEGDVLDAALIGAAQRVEHYEIAGYGTVIAFAEELGESEHVSLLNETLNEEKETDEKLTALAGEINAKANQAAEGDEEEIQKAGSKKKSRSAA